MLQLTPRKTIQEILIRRKDHVQVSKEAKNSTSPNASFASLIPNPTSSTSQKPQNLQSFIVIGRNNGNEATICQDKNNDPVNCCCGSVRYHRTGNRHIFDKFGVVKIPKKHGRQEPDTPTLWDRAEPGSFLVQQQGLPGSWHTQLRR